MQGVVKVQNTTYIETKGILIHLIPQARERLDTLEIYIHISSFPSSLADIVWRLVDCYLYICRQKSCNVM
jgi:hypothetical protein